MDTMYPQVNENVDVERYIYLAILPTAKSLNSFSLLNSATNFLGRCFKSF